MEHVLSYSTNFLLEKKFVEHRRTVASAKDSVDKKDEFVWWWLNKQSGWWKMSNKANITVGNTTDEHSCISWKETMNCNKPWRTVIHYEQNCLIRTRILPILAIWDSRVQGLSRFKDALKKERFEKKPFIRAGRYNGKTNL